LNIKDLLKYKTLILLKDSLVKLDKLVWAESQKLKA
jgi:hypothetical protein